jgi:hypothetical protein|nr:hypothetical protein [Kofleriaceae bacterium]
MSKVHIAAVIVAASCGSPSAPPPSAGPATPPIVSAPPPGWPGSTGSAGSAGSASARADEPPPPRLDFVVAGDDPGDGGSGGELVRFATVDATGLHVTRTVHVPGNVTSLVWLGAQPVVALHDDELGVIAGSGYVPFATVPDAKWRVPKPKTSDASAPTDRFDSPRWRTLVGSDGAVWQARCDWGWDLPHGIAHHCVPEGGRCDAWVFARVSPGPLTVTQTKPSAAFDTGDDSLGTRTDEVAALGDLGAPPQATPSPVIDAKIVSVPIQERGGEPRPVLRCVDHRIGSKPIQYPTDDDRDARDGVDGVGDPQWLATSPPMFSVSRRVSCLDVLPIIFEGCAPSQAFPEGTVVAGGPHDVLVLYTGAKLVLRWHDRELASLDDVSKLAFAPAN